MHRHQASWSLIMPHDFGLSLISNSHLEFIEPLWINVDVNDFRHQFRIVGAWISSDFGVSHGLGSLIRASVIGWRASI